MTNVVRLILAGDSSGAEQAIGSVGDKMGKFGKIAAVAGGVAGAGFGMALSNAVDISSMQSKLDAQLGTTSGVSQKAGEVAGKVFGDGYSASMSEVGDAVKTVMQSGAVSANDTAEAIQGITEKAMTLSSVFGQDLEGTTNAVAQMIRTGLAQNGQQAMDMLAAGFQQGNDKAGDLLDTMNEYGTQFRKLGMDGTMAMGLIKQGLQGGARDADLVADAIKEFSIRAVDGSKSTAAGFQAIGLNAQEMTAKIAKGGPEASQGLATVLDRLRGIKDPAQQAQAAVALFGTQAEDLGQALYALDPSTAVAGMGQVAGAADRMKASNESAQQKVQALKNQFTLLTGEAINSVGPLGTVAQWGAAFGGDAVSMAGSLGMVAAGFGSMLAPIGRAIAAAAVWSAQTVAQAAVAVARFIVTAVLYIAQWVIMGVSAMASAVVMAAAWFIALGPVGWVIAIVIGLVALIIANWDTVKNWTIQAFTAIWNFLVTVWNTIVNSVINFVTMLVTQALAAWNMFKAANAALWNTILTFILNLWGNIVGFFQGIPGRIGSAFGSLGSIIGGVFKSAMNTAVSWVNWGIDKINGLINGINYVGGFVGLSIPTIPHVPSFHTGGVVPGPKGSEMLAVLQAGETVLPTQGGRGVGGGGSRSVTFSGDLDSAMATAFMRMVREGKIQIG